MTRRNCLTPFSLVLLGLLTMILSDSRTHAETPAGNAAGLIGWISIEPRNADAAAGPDQMLLIAGRVLALRPVQGRYSLELKKIGRSGVSNSRQGGAFTLAAGETAALSRNALNIGPADSLDITLTIFEDEREVLSVTVKPATASALRRL